VVFLPNVTTLDLAEVDRRHRYLLAGAAEHYHGEAVNPKNLSWGERWRGPGAAYDPQADKEQQLLQAHAGA
jgi:hypothetical protein